VEELPARRTIMRREFSVLIEKDEDGWFVATVPQLRGCHTQAKSMDKLLARVREAIELCLDVETASPWSPQIL
jgi:predicted RNase H-like HicB family nuclease